MLRVARINSCCCCCCYCCCCCCCSVPSDVTASTCARPRAKALASSTRRTATSAAPAGSENASKSAWTKMVNSPPPSLSFPLNTSLKITKNSFKKREKIIIVIVCVRNVAAVQHERGPRNSTLRRQMSMFYATSKSGGSSENGDSPPPPPVAPAAPVTPSVAVAAPAVVAQLPLPSQTSPCRSDINHLTLAEHMTMIHRSNGLLCAPQPKVNAAIKSTEKLIASPIIAGLIQQLTLTIKVIKTLGWIRRMKPVREKEQRVGVY